MAHTTSDYTISPIDAATLSAGDLRDEVANNPNDPVECVVINFYSADGLQRSDTAEGVYFPGVGRMGIAWGANASWADATSLEAGVAMWATDQDAWEAAN